MDFLIQKDDISVLDIENILLKDAIKKSRGINSFIELSIDAINDSLSSKIIPVGTIDFVTKFLKVKYGIMQQNPIEIPKYLLQDEFLKRDYRIIYGKDLPRKGNYFIKNAEKLKDFTYTGCLEHFIFDEMFDEPSSELDNTLRLKKDGLYILSSNFYPVSEYRAYIINGEIVSITNYDGNPLLLPDVKMLSKAVGLINFNEKWLKSYTVDLMVNNKGQTAIIEVHNFASCGIYTNMINGSLPLAYTQGIDYLLNDNSKRISSV